ncbi:hypothetical protein DYB25_002496 [Aphanomyces astaci]|uniref:LYC1 C-terminal domain-containing protein n=1 Tax=Aphanomyces astaci TaxID=112090 RepID=A0A397AXR9_APHAT|nr:hypothetical protein DYB25_002496 [Aphanomyces astaci]
MAESDTVYVLVPASEAQQLEADKYTYSSWGAPLLTLDEYLDREHALCASAFAKESLTGYVLVPATTPSTVDILCYVEVFKRPVWYNGARLYGYSVGSVYTPEQHRKKGYASIMLRLVLAYMRADQQQHQPDNASSVNLVISNLYSDIGPSFYASKGWAVHASEQLVLPSTHAMLSTSRPPSVTAVDSLDVLAQVCQADVTRMQQLTCSSAVYFELTPSVADDAFILWTHDFKRNVLSILRCHAATAATFAVLMDAALDEARQWHLASVVTWNPHPAWLDDQLISSVETRTESLPSLLVSNGHDTVHHPVQWLANDKYAWV